MVQVAKTLVLSSGGKDSILALHKACNLGLRVEGIITILPEDPESMLYHTYNVIHVKKIAESTGIRWYGVVAKKDEEERALERFIGRLSAEVLVSGEIASNYQKEKFDKIADSVDMRHFTPLWGMKPREVLEEILLIKMDVIIVAVAAYGLGEEWLGRHLTEESIGELLRLSEKYHFNPTGEGGDIESFVLDAPLYKKRLRLLRALKTWEKDRGSLEIRELVLEDK
ncbi:MAG: diphthine--ammonia ligase [Candidatus Methylarchaceae archaeon HK01M]|nr:diphthine--ammonia ligase [Candidatus Methylarchaceae archaeon HK01M]